jgi:hypothetical protein
MCKGYSEPVSIRDANGQPDVGAFNNWNSAYICITRGHIRRYSCNSSSDARGTAPPRIAGMNSGMTLSGVVSSLIGCVSTIVFPLFLPRLKRDLVSVLWGEFTPAFRDHCVKVY